MIGRTSSHSRDHEESAALHALGMLEGKELAVFEQHLGACPECRRIVDEDREALMQLSARAPEMDPPSGFKSHLMARIALELAASERRVPSILTAEGFRKRVMWAAPLAAMFCVMLALGSIFGQQMTLRQVLVSVPLQGDVGSGSTVVVYRSGASTVELRGLGDPPPGQLYAIWLMGSDDGYALLGTYEEGNGTCPLDRPVLGGSLVVTLEPSPVPSAPTSKPLLAATIAQ